MNFFKLSDSSKGPEADFVLNGLKNYNEKHIYPYKHQDLVVSVFNEQEKQIGGLVGYTAWEWLYIRLLWVQEDSHGMGLGTQLVKKAEAEAVRRGVQKVWIDTFNEQAKKLYEKMGYQVFGTLSDFPPGHTRYFLSRHISR